MDTLDKYKLLLRSTTCVNDAFGNLSRVMIEYGEVLHDTLSIITDDELQNIQRQVNQLTRIQLQLIGSKYDLFNRLDK